MKLSHAASMPARRPPRFAEQSTSILDELGCPPDEIAALRAAGVAPEQPMRRTPPRPIPEEKST